MAPEIYQVGNHFINIHHVAGANREGGTLYVYLAGGRFITLRGPDAAAFLAVLRERSLDLHDPSTPPTH